MNRIGRPAAGVGARDARPPGDGAERVLTSHTVGLSAAQGEELRGILEEEGYRFGTLEHANYRAEKDAVKVVLYRSGKLVVQGKGTREFIEFVLEPRVLKEARLGYEAVLNPGLYSPRIGIDESGKGDFFGPLCVSGVYVNEAVLRRWEGAGVRDSKQVGNDAGIERLAKVIRETPGCVWTVVPIGNAAYNRLYSKMRSVNAVLAWGHARCIENLLQSGRKLDPFPERAVSDQFAHDKATVADALLRLGRELELVQRHKAESDMAVAAASILARSEFVTRLKRLGEDFGMTFPKGGGAPVDAAATEFVKRHGPNRLGEVAKMHFRNSYRALGQPEPPRVEWRRPSKGS